MFKIHIHATGSKGNAYTIEDSGHKILIDPGIRFKRLQQKTNFTLSKYDFCLLSHEHKDHSRSIHHLLNLGMNCYMSAGTRDALGIMHSSALITFSTHCFERDGWRVLSFGTVHDAAEPLGFLIESPSGRKICFATDTAWVNFKFSGVSHWIIEANYSEELLAANGRLPEETKNRIRASHFSIERLVEFFGGQDLSATEKIFLIHLSGDNSDEDKFRKSIQKIVGDKIMVSPLGRSCLSPESHLL